MMKTLVSHLQRTQTELRNAALLAHFFNFVLCLNASPFCSSSFLLDMMVKSCNPVVFSFYNYLRTHPLIIRRHFANPEGTTTTVGLTAEKSSADEINLIERKLFFTTANAHFKVWESSLDLLVHIYIKKQTWNVHIWLHSYPNLL